MTPSVRRVADIRYGEVLGYRPLELDLYLPEGSEVPVVVYVHGGGWQRGRDSLPGDSRLRGALPRSVCARVEALDCAAAGAGLFPH